MAVLGGTAITDNNHKITMIEDSKIVTPETNTVKQSNNRLIHGHARRGKWTAEFRAWHSMNCRCKYPCMKGYENYGGRGIKVCDRWLNSFENFLADIGLKPSPKHSLGRINNDGNYEPGNVRWETKLEQDNNRRTSVYFTHNGETLSVTQWARKFGMKIITLDSRLRDGWSIEMALTTKVKQSKRNATFNGETMCLSDWSKRAGISKELLYYRLSHGWPFEQAISVSPDATNRIGTILQVPHQANTALTPVGPSLDSGTNILNQTPHA